MDSTSTWLRLGHSTIGWCAYIIRVTGNVDDGQPKCTKLECHPEYYGNLRSEHNTNISDNCTCSRNCISLFGM